jgi:hypothetical protein
MCGSNCDILLIMVLLKPDTIAIDAIIIIIASAMPNVAIFRVNADDSADLPVRYKCSFLMKKSSNLISVNKNGNMEYVAKVYYFAVYSKG